MLTSEQMERYSRNMLLKEIGVKGQEKLLGAKVLIIGAGGLGSPAALYLAAAGVGTIGIADSDRVDLTNLQRQILHASENVGKKKVLSAEESLHRLNPEIRVCTYPVKVKADNILDLIADYDFILDGTDSFAAKFLINDACVLAGKPFSHAGVLGFEGQLMTYAPGQGPCYRCIFREPPKADEVPTCRELGVLGAVTGVIGSLQALEAVKYITGAGDLLTGKLLTFNGLTMNFRTVELPKDTSDCPVCGDHPSITKPVDYEEPFCEKCQ